MRKGGNLASNDDKTSEIIKSNCANISNTQCAATGSGQVLSMCVAPVNVQHKVSNKEIIITFAMLDTCSQGTFATENLMNQLDINGIQTSIGIGTFNWSPKAVILFTGWFICFKAGTRTQRKSKVDQTLLIFTRKEFPVDQSEIATPA